MKMKIIITILSCILYCQTNTTTPAITNDNMNPTKIKLTINKRIFTATLVNNKTAIGFKSKLPLSIKMVELNGNEKYGELSNPLPTESVNPERIQVGDLMLYGNQTLVLFYKSFNTSYQYTKIGKIDDTKHLYEALGDGNATITIE
jgi:hypothetical protein